MHISLNTNRIISSCCLQAVLLPRMSPMVLLCYFMLYHNHTKHVIVLGPHLMVSYILTPTRMWVSQILSLMAYTLQIYYFLCNFLCKFTVTSKQPTMLSYFLFCSNMLFSCYLLFPHLCRYSFHFEWSHPHGLLHPHTNTNRALLDTPALSHTC